MPTAVALIPTDLVRTRLGLPSLVGHPLPAARGPCVLAHLVRRVCKVPQVRAVILVHPADQDPLALLPGSRFDKPVIGFAADEGLFDAYHQHRTAARKWALGSWRGGLGGASCYDELLPAKALAAALAQHKADAALLAGADWALIDPELCAQVLALHLANPDAMQLTFCQAPPGLSGLALGRKLLDQLADNPDSTIGSMMAYHPTRAQADPIGRDVCVQVAGVIRSCTARLIYDTPRSAALLEALAQQLGDKLDDADAQTVAEGVAALAAAHEGGLEGFAALPPMVTLELTPQRVLDGPVIPQHHIKLDRQSMSLDLALRIVRQLAVPGDVALTLGGLGDALLYPKWESVVDAAHEAGVLGIAIDTDLLVDTATLDRLSEAPIDLINVRLNADSPAGYAQANGTDHHRQVLDNIGHIMNRRAQSNVKTDDLPSNRPGGCGVRHLRCGLPWIVPRFVKTVQTLPEMETFFDRWMHFTQHAAIDPATSGQSSSGPLMPDMSPVCMAPPKRIACRQLMGRMSIHSNGTVARCDQDWLGHGRVASRDATDAADTAKHDLADIWRSMRTLRQAHAAGQWNEQGICASCHEWHRP